MMNRPYRTIPPDWLALREPQAADRLWLVRDEVQVRQFKALPAQWPHQRPHRSSQNQEVRAFGLGICTPQKTYSSGGSPRC